MAITQIQWMRSNCGIWYITDDICCNLDPYIVDDFGNLTSMSYEMCLQADHSLDITDIGDNK